MKNVWTQKLFRLIGGWLLSRMRRGWQKKSKHALRTKKRKIYASEPKTLPKVLRFLKNRFRLLLRSG